jgi:hypothetical protein
MLEGLMSWDNYGEWHIDHIIPVSSFKIDPNNWPATIKTIWAIENLQPLWAIDNIKKGQRIGHLDTFSLP